MKKLVLIAAIVLLSLTLFRSLSTGQPVSPAEEPVTGGPPTVSSSSSTTAQAPSAGLERREIVLTAKQWTYEPFRLTAQQGEKLRIRLATADVAHSFMLPLVPGGEMAHITAEPGQPASVDVDVVQAPGTYYL